MTKPVAPEKLLEKTLVSPGDSVQLAKLRSRAREVLAVLESGDVERDLEQLVEREEINPEWLARVLETLSSAEHEPEGAERLFPHADEDSVIGMAFRDILMSSLPPPVRSIETWLRKAPSIPADEQAELAIHPDVEAAQPFPKALLAKGVTPLTVYQALEALTVMTHRARRHGILPRNKPLTIDVINGALEVAPDPLRAESVVQEIASMADCNVDLARGLAHWTIPLAWCVPKALDLLEVRRSPAGIELSPSDGTIPDLSERWKASPSLRISGLSEIIRATQAPAEEPRPLAIA